MSARNYLEGSRIVAFLGRVLSRGMDRLKSSQAAGSLSILRKEFLDDLKRAPLKIIGWTLGLAVLTNTLLLGFFGKITPWGGLGRGVLILLCWAALRHSTSPWEQVKQGSWLFKRFFR